MLRCGQAILLAAWVQRQFDIRRAGLSRFHKRQWTSKIGFDPDPPPPPPLADRQKAPRGKLQNVEVENG